MIEQLLHTNKGVFIGEMHHDLAVKDWLAQNTTALKGQWCNTHYTKLVWAKNQVLLEILQGNPKADKLLLER